MFCLDDKLSDPVSITGWNWTKTERKIRETIENGWNCQNEIELSKWNGTMELKSHKTIWNWTKYSVTWNRNRSDGYKNHLNKWGKKLKLQRIVQNLK